jgi:hypothetical protein
MRGGNQLAEIWEHLFLAFFFVAKLNQKNAPCSSSFASMVPGLWPEIWRNSGIFLLFLLFGRNLGNFSGKLKISGFFDLGH